MRQGFWPENNVWWGQLAQRMAQGKASEEDWKEADARLWCLSRYVPEAKELCSQDRHDLVQTVLVQLQESKTLKRLAEVETPAHYLARVMRNHLRNQQKRNNAARRAARRRAKRVETDEDQRPDEQVAWAEWCAKARYVVNHLVSASDRKLLWWFYKDGLSVKEIAARLKCREGAVLQRLVRARKRVRDQFKV